ncbi:adenine phosphoribosyltransferase [Helicobacter ailurogastricus]|uniref:Adenine phosphoribosyltransferase n=1 Tax=Helicobacter ailurogastricus TaxID=1578720 RepID=A0A0K2XE54_9HELI|nr:adenine phosphoribosyltransferase [Helicobacter ailurogastricus]CRF40730.1 Adenine phosphoribosyltransferase [Helicobacter ailurogastricus]CRF43122.1 Adenine phosphoribosyltransferase [Helicobacter ailurogastricus]CRF44351.1 Adenine phosphoribosyltransferase [Helicobacter ailurogastricus]CRF52176.1 Adenine phosphoribosyltransferase [Helicobacter ailurogastricus]BDQ29295.1 adenine phosphoribosyltransferase [Helicobacter ailurogastricus]
MFSQKLKAQLREAIREVQDHPKPGVLFKDITPLINHSMLFGMLIDALRDRYKLHGVDFVAGIEARGFILGAALAYALQAGFVPIRKQGKLPCQTLSASYSLEYGADTIEIHADALRELKDAHVVLIDDLIATGGTALASLELLDKLQAHCVEACFLISLNELEGLQKVAERVSAFSVLEYDK